MGDTRELAQAICETCGKVWPAALEVCPDDNTWLNDETIAESARPVRPASVADVQFEDETVDTSTDRKPFAASAQIDGAALLDKLISADTPLDNSFGDNAGTPLSVPPYDDARGPKELPRGTRIGEYDVEAKIGEGAMGTVYRAVHPTIGKHVAIKVISPRVFEEADAVHRFVAEARAVAAIRHPGIVHVFGFGRLTDGRLYLTMEWLEGCSLGARMAQGRIPVPEALDIIRQIARALEAAHAKKIVHRDLKPENVFLHYVEDEVMVKVLDFGLAKVTNREEALVARTRTGQILGTPVYMSPEQCRSKGVDHRTDIYALGCICYEMLVGRLPFDHDNAAELISAHLTLAPPSPRSLWPEIPPNLDALLTRMLAKDPAERPTLQEVRRTVTAGRRGTSEPLPALAPPPPKPSFGESVRTEIRPPAELPPPRRWPAVIAVVAGIALMIVLGVVAFSTLRAAKNRAAPVGKSVPVDASSPDAAPLAP